MILAAWLMEETSEEMACRSYGLSSSGILATILAGRRWVKERSDLTAIR